MRTILIVGGGYAGFYTAWKLEKQLAARGRAGDHRPPTVHDLSAVPAGGAAGSIEARHAAVSLRSHLRRTQIIAAAPR